MTAWNRATWACFSLKLMWVAFFSLWRMARILATGSTHDSCSLRANAETSRLCRTEARLRDLKDVCTTFIPVLKSDLFSQASSHDTHYGLGFLRTGNFALNSSAA